MKKAAKGADTVYRLHAAAAGKARIEMSRFITIYNKVRII